MYTTWTERFLANVSVFLSFSFLLINYLSDVFFRSISTCYLLLLVRQCHIRHHLFKQRVKANVKKITEVHRIATNCYVLLTVFIFFFLLFSVRYLQHSAETSWLFYHYLTTFIIFLSFLYPSLHTFNLLMEYIYFPDRLNSIRNDKKNHVYINIHTAQLLLTKFRLCFV